MFLVFIDIVLFKILLGGFKLNCNKCGCANKVDDLFCRKCGANLKNNNIICRINRHINILSVLIGFFIAVMVLIVGAFLFSGIAKNENLPFYIGIVLFTMALIGSIFSGALGNDNAKDGMINGGILSFFILVLTSFMVGIVILAFVGIGSSIMGIFGSGVSSNVSSTALLNSTTSTLGSGVSDILVFIIKFVVSIIAIFVVGMLGGTFGVYLKEAFN